ncbi:MAG: beta-glucosidase [Acholeplasma sp.]|jgi:beta-glucosidase|nr:MAG: beta-glucosidase [Acholeplasma sp.]
MAHKFPKDFIFGAATSAYQIEGAAFEDGRGQTMWDVIHRDQEGKPTQDVGDIACDHYHRYKDDIKLMKELGLQSYRFSISWVRIYPQGAGEINPLGVNFYQNLIDELIKNGIEPTATLWHGDLPLVYDEKGGWLNPEVIEHYLNYAKTCFDLFGDRVKIWYTHNEPWCAAFLNEHPLGDQLQIAHHLMIAHARVIKLYRNHLNGDGKIGIVLNLGKQYPKTFEKMDQFAARNVDGFVNRWFLDPVIKGEYPKDMMELYRKQGHHFIIESKDLDELKRYPMDFLGINMYSRGVQSYAPFNPPFYAQDYHMPEAIYTEMGWEVCPSSLYELLMDIKEKYHNIEVFITENGAAFKDEMIDNKIHDPLRADFIKKHLEAVQKAISHGVNVTRYYAWSLFDNFEWGLGYSKRFGIIHIDYETQKRTIKASGYCYQRIIQKRSL